MRLRPSLRLQALAVLLAPAALAPGCALNPATGQSQLALFTEAEEIELGAEVDHAFLSNSGIYEDSELEAYVAGLGARLAAVSERPDLPWSFRIADDETVNAFALPGGRVYVTRGLLAHLDREAELAGVLGHEIGHVTARHSVNALSRELAISLGLAAGLELLEAGETGQWLTSVGMGLVFLKFGRNQERQADQLGVRYAQRAGFDPHGAVDALRVLQRVSEAESDGWLPTWLSTHPDPDRRWRRLASESGLGAAPPAAALAPEIERYLARLDGIVYGPDPRNGVVRDNLYVQLREDYQMPFPRGWEIQREGQTVAAESPDGEALVMLLPQTATALEEAAAAFAAEEGIAVGRHRDLHLGGLPARLAYFSADLEGDTARGIVGFVRTRTRVVAVIGLTTAELWPQRGQMLESTVRAISRVRRPETYPSTLDQLAVVTLPRAMDPREIAAAYSPHAEPGAVALLNRVAADQPIPAGRRVKVIRRDR